MKEKLGKIVKTITLLVSFLLIGLSSVEVISGLVGDFTLFGFNLTEAQEKATHYLTSGGLAVLGGAGVAIDALLNRKYKNAMNVVKVSVDKFSEVKENYKVLEKKFDDLLGSYKTLRTDFIDQNNNTIKAILENTELAKRFIALLEADINSKLSNPLIEEKAKELLERALEYGKETSDNLQDS